MVKNANRALMWTNVLLFCTAFSAAADRAAGRLFPTDVAANEWVEFEGEGFSRPVTGVIFRDGSASPGMPLGSLGTGFISLDGKGTLDYYSTIFNAFLERHYRSPQKDEFVRHRSEVPNLKLPFLGLSIGGRSWVLSLDKVPGAESARQIHYWGHYPVADLEYELSAPIGVALRAWAPFFPGDAVSSNVPGSIFEVRLRNDTQIAHTGTLVFSFHGPRQEEIAFNSGPERQYITPSVQYQRKQISGPLSGVAVETSWDAKLYSYVLASIGNQAHTGAGLTGESWKSLARGLPEPGPAEPGASLAVDFSLAPGETRNIRFVFSWYAPHWESQYRQVGRSHFEYSHQYASRFTSAQEVAEHLARQHEPLLKRILRWQEVIYSEKALPGWLQDSLINVLAVLPQQSFWLRKTTDPGHWWGPQGLFTVNESLLACAQQSCLANDEFGEWPVNIFFPEMARNKLRQFKHYQKRNGQVPSTLGSGTEPDQPWYDQQLTIDGQVYVQMVDRYWQITGDDTILDEFYPSVKAQMSFMKTVDFDQDGLPDVKGNNQYYDSWPMAGAAIHVSGYWLATLRIAERMAQKLGDHDFAEDCRSWYERGARSIEQKLWKEETGSYLLYHQPESGKISDTVLSDQLIGQYFAYLHDLPRIFSKERVRTVLKTIWRNNLTPYGVRLALKPDGSPDYEGNVLSTAIQPSYSSIVPALLMMCDVDRSRGEELMYRTWRHLILDLKMGWDMPGGLEPNGDHRWGLEYYHNTMLWSFAPAVLGQNLKSLAQPGQLVDRIKRAAR